jgi:uncharacterized protein (TIGR03067 family)
MKVANMKILLAWGLGVLLLAGLAVAGEGKDDQSKIQGAWKGEFDGKKIAFEFAKDKFSVKFSDGNKDIVFKGTVKLDPKKKPKEMDLMIEEGKDFGGQTSRAIYDLDGDTLKWCANEPGKEERPKVFPDKEGENNERGHLYLILKRDKK